MADSLLYKFTINSIDVTSYVLKDTRIVLNRNSNSGNRAIIQIASTVTNIIPDLSVGMSIIIQRGVLSSTETTKFVGKIKTISNNQLNLELSCYDWIQELNYLYFSKSYDRDIDTEAGEISAIAQNIIEDGGFPASVVSSGTSSTDITLKKFISRDQSRRDRLYKLSKLIDYIFYHDYENSYIRFEPINFTTYPNSLVVGTNVYNIPIWEEDIEGMRNKITVKGAFDEDTRQQLFNGDGSTSTFTLTWQPNITELYVNGVLQVRGIANSTENYDYTVDSERNTFTFESGSIPPSGTNNIIMTYTTRIPAPAIGNNPSSIAQYGVVQEEIFTYSDIVNVEDAETRLSALLNKLSIATPTTTLNTNEFDLYPGQLVNVEDTYNPNRNGTYTVNEIVITYPQLYDEVKIGDINFNLSEVLESINNRIRDIEERETNLTQLLKQIIGLFRTLNYERRYCLLEKSTVAGNTGIYGYPGPRGRYGSAVYGVDSATVTTGQILQGNNTYKELLYDNEFYDSSNSTATWNTSTKELTFTSSQIIQTLQLFKGTTYTSVKCTLGQVTGTIEIQISADNGTTWQTILNDVKTSLLNSNSNGVLLRLIETGSSTATIISQFDAYNNVIVPAIQLLLEE